MRQSTRQTHHVLAFLNEKPRSLVLAGALVVVIWSRAGDLSVDGLMALSVDDERWRVSLRMSFKLTLSCEYGTVVVSSISINFDAMLENIEVGTECGVCDVQQRVYG